MPTGPKQSQSDTGPDDKCTDDISYHGLIVYTIVFVIAPLCVACASCLIILGKYYPVNAECLQPWSPPPPSPIPPAALKTPNSPKNRAFPSPVGQCYTTLNVRTVTPVIPSRTQPASFVHNPPVVMVSGLARKRRGWGGNGAFGFTAFVMRALPRARQRSKEQLGVKRRQAGTSRKDKDDSKDIRLKWKHSQILEKEWKILW